MIYLSKLFLFHLSLESLTEKEKKKKKLEGGNQSIWISIHLYWDWPVGLSVNFWCLVTLPITLPARPLVLKIGKGKLESPNPKKQAEQEDYEKWLHVVSTQKQELWHDKGSTLELCPAVFQKLYSQDYLIALSLENLLSCSVLPQKNDICCSNLFHLSVFILNYVNRRSSWSLLCRVPWKMALTLAAPKEMLWKVQLIISPPGVFFTWKPHEVKPQPWEVT